MNHQVTNERKHINGVPRENYGVWCHHGEHIMVVDPTDRADYPRTVPSKPWPCSQCTFEEFVSDMDKEVDTYYDNMRQEIWPG